MVRPGGRAMTPALQIRTSRRVLRERNFLAPSWTLEREARSSERNVIGTEGCLVWRSVMSFSALVVERPVKKIWAGEWAARRVTVWAPRPAVPILS